MPRHCAEIHTVSLTPMIALYGGTTQGLTQPGTTNSGTWSSASRMVIVKLVVAVRAEVSA